MSSLFFLRCWMCARVFCEKQGDSKTVCSNFVASPGLQRHLSLHRDAVPVRERVKYLNENPKGGEMNE